MCRAGQRSVRLTRGMTASIYPAETIPASQPACVLVRDQASMNCGSSAGTIEYPATPRISAAHIAATIAGEGPVGTELAELVLTGDRTAPEEGVTGAAPDFSRSREARRFL